MPNSSIRHDIYERIFNFIVEVLNLTEKLPRTYSNHVITNQIVRSVTSMGANSQEADGTTSKKDFLHCFTITRKEGKETIYWLRLIEKLNKNPDSVSKLLKEGNEILAIVSAIIKNTLANSKSHS